MIKNSLTYMNSCRIVSAGIILVLSVILVLQTYITENVFEQGRVALASPFAIRMSNAKGEVYAEDYVKLGHLLSEYEAFDVMANNYLDYKYDSWFGSGDRIAITSYYKDCGSESSVYFISDEVLAIINQPDTLSISDNLYYGLVDRDNFIESNGEIKWRFNEKTYSINFASGANVDVNLLKDTEGGMIASVDTYKEIIGDSPVGDLYVCAAGNIKLTDFIKLIYELEFKEEYEMRLVFSPVISDYLKQLLRNNLIIFLGVFNMMQITFFVLSGRKKEFDIMLLCGSTYKEIRLNRFINLCLYFVPATIIGSLFFNFLSAYVLTEEYKYHVMNMWQRAINVVLFIIFQLIAYIVYEIFEGKAGNKKL